MTKSPSILKRIKDFKTPEINYAFQKSISYSQISMYKSCPKKWALQYRDGHKIAAPSINMVFGTAMHETLQNYLTVMYEESGAKADTINLEEYFEEHFREEYSKEYQSNKNIHFSNSEEMRDFYDDGVAILEWFKKHRREYFSSKGWHLAGIEIPIVLSLDKRYNNVLFNGFIDLVMYHEPTDKFVIYDIKTSRQSWGDSQKKDKIKQSQLVLYKIFFSKLFGVDINKIEIEFFILKRKIWENSDFPQSRIQTFTPPSGKTSMNKSIELVTDFLEQTFNVDGSYSNKEHIATPSKETCRFCPYLNTKLCSEGKTS